MGGRPCFPIGKKPPLNPPLSGGQKLSPFGRVRPERGEVCCRCPPDKGDPPEGGRGFFFREPPCFPSGRKPPLIPPYQGGKSSPPSGEYVPKGGMFVAVVPLIRGIPPKGGGGFFSGSRPAPLIPLIREVLAVVPLIRRIKWVYFSGLREEPPYPPFS